jgi:hypothetical protein
LSAFENKVLTIFGPKKFKVKASWRKLNNEEFHALFSRYD